MDKNNLFEIRQLKVSSTSKTLLQIESLDLPAQQLIALIGANGAGKSTLIHGLLGKVAGCQISGKIHCRGQKVEQIIRQGKIAWVGQHERFELPLTALDYVLLGVMPNLSWYQRPSLEHVNQAQQLLKDFDLLKLADKRIQHLSGGEKQRLAIVRALMQKTEILLFDEPTNHLDIKHQRYLLHYLQTLVHQQQKSIIVVLHSLTQAYRYADMIIAMNTGGVLAQGTPEEVMTDERLEQMYQVPITAYETHDGKIFA